MLPFDGPRSTMFENDCQMYFVTFSLRGAVMDDVKFYIPRMHHEMVAKVDVSSSSPGNAVFNINQFNETFIKWERTYDMQLEELFKAKYAERLVVRRIQKDEGTRP